MCKWLSSFPKRYISSRSCLISRKISNKLLNSGNLFMPSMDSEELYKTRSAVVFDEINYMKSEEIVPSQIITSEMTKYMDKPIPYPPLRCHPQLWAQVYQCCHWCKSTSDCDQVHGRGLLQLLCPRQDYRSCCLAQIALRHQSRSHDRLSRNHCQTAVDTLVK